MNTPQPYSPIKFGLVWNVEKRTWVHWDGNTNSPIARNLLASLGLGAPMHGKHAGLDFAVIKRQTDLSEKIRPPRYPFLGGRGPRPNSAPLFQANCNSCHGGPETDRRLHSVAEIGTDPRRAEMFTQKLADGFNKFLAHLERDGTSPRRTFGVRSTGKYFAPHPERGLGALAFICITGRSGRCSNYLFRLNERVENVSSRFACPTTKRSRVYRCWILRFGYDDSGKLQRRP